MSSIAPGMIRISADEYAKFMAFMSTVSPKPLPSEPAVTEPIATKQPAVAEPVTTEPAATEPVTTEPVAKQPVSTVHEDDEEYCVLDRENGSGGKTVANAPQTAEVEEYILRQTGLIEKRFSEEMQRIEQSRTKSLNWASAKKAAQLKVLERVKLTNALPIALSAKDAPAPKSDWKFDQAAVDEFCKQAIDVLTKGMAALTPDSVMYDGCQIIVAKFEFDVWQVNNPDANFDKLSEHFANIGFDWDRKVLRMRDRYIGSNMVKIESSKCIGISAPGVGSNNGYKMFSYGDIELAFMLNLATCKIEMLV